MYILRLPGLASDSAPSWQDTMFSLHNYERRVRGITPYLRSPLADRIGQARTDDMSARRYFGHKTPEGLTGYVIELGKLGVTSWDWAGENIARNRGFAKPIETAMRGFMDSPTHRRNILEPEDFTHLGVGYTLSPEGYHIFACIFLGGVSNHEHP